MGTPHPTPLHRDPLRVGLPPYPRAEMEAGDHAQRVEVNVGARGEGGPSSPPLPVARLPPPPATTTTTPPRILRLLVLPRYPVRPPPYEEDEEKQHEEAGGGADEEHEKESQQLKRARACVCDNLEARHTRWL